MLDVATGTGLVAAALLERGFRVTGLDQSPEMLARARARLGGRVELVEASADAIPFPTSRSTTSRSPTSSATSTTRRATLAELARVVRPGGDVAMLEFGLPRGIWRPPWNLWVDVGLPVAGRLISPGWHEVGRFLGPSIRDFHDRYPEPRAARALAGRRDRGLRVRRRSLGGGLVVWGRRVGR